MKNIDSLSLKMIEALDKLVSSTKAKTASAKALLEEAAQTG